MKISELSKELGVASKELIVLANENGIECKAATKNLSDDEVKTVKDAFAKANGKGTEEKAAEKEKPVSVSEVKEPVKSAEKEEKKEKKAEVKPENKPVAKAEPKNDKNNEVKKSPKFNFKINPQFVSGNSTSQAPKKPNQNQGMQQGRNTQQRPAPMPTRLIKPTTPPSGAPSVNFVPEHSVKTSKPSENVKDTKETVVNKEPEKVQTTASEVKANVNENNNNAVRKNQDYTSNTQNQDNRNNRNQRPQRDNRDFKKNDGQGFKKNPQNGPFAQKGDNASQGRFPAKNNNAKFDQGSSAAPAPGDKRKDDKRRSSQEKDKKKNNYDDRYEDGMGQKGKALKPGAFIKPEKKVEKVEEDIKVLTLPEVLTIRDLADKMKLQPSTIVKKLFLAGEIVTVNTEISFEKAEEIAMEYDILCEKEEKVDVIEELLKEEDENEDKLVERPPVICVMGHVDHGKTSLLDAIRNTHVIDREAGGITQHIGAYQVKINDKNITFLDTPGHEAFTAMRMRGATSTDIAVLVVAADDGVMPQTVEAISHAKAAGVPIIVAVNKVDKIGYDFEDKTKDMVSYPQISQLMTELATDHELNPEVWGGDTIYVPVSAKKGLGIDNLLENILISAEILELKSNPNRKARGLVIEAKLEKGRGPVATVLVQKGTLKVGDFISAGEAHGKVRAMINDKKENVKVATPSTPVEILGLNQAPSAGDVFIAHENDKEAKHFADTFIAEHKIKKIEDTKSKMSLDDVFTKIKEDNLKSLNIIVKADVQGSVEAVRQSLEKISNEEVVVKVIHGGVGAINESDVTLASASDAIIIGFNVRIDNQAKDTADREGVDVRLYSVIYNAIEDVEAAMKGLLEPIFEEKVIGHCEVRQIFKANAIGNIAGSYVLDGIVKRGCSVRISREGEQIFEGKLASLKRFKDDVKEVKSGFECGLVFEGFNGIQELDIVEAYEMVEVPR
ncbi:MAG: translation initiation factor IF-2 [Lachnospiraceae bacterium]|nr:translation initiation factor IF-2 [Lachnospiraceae bacterium]